jgi:hypothetical protein
MSGTWKVVPTTLLDAGFLSVVPTTQNRYAIMTSVFLLRMGEEEREDKDKTKKKKMTSAGRRLT